MEESIKLQDGEYEILLIDNGKEFKALRHGEDWRNLTGDNLILALFYKIQELEKEKEEDENIISKMAGRIKEFEDKGLNYD